MLLGLVHYYNPDGTPKCDLNICHCKLCSSKFVEEYKDEQLEVKYLEGWAECWYCKVVHHEEYTSESPEKDSDENVPLQLVFDWMTPL